jgi:outer membrane protein insertion porin family
LRKRLFELVEGRIAYRYEQVDIQNVSPAAAPVIREQAGIRSVSQVGLNLLRDTRNDLIFPTRGSRVELRNTVAGGPFLGDTDYWKVEARGSRFFKVFDFLEQTVSVIGRIGHVMPYGDSDEVPFFDRFFLGGPETLRGFEFREVGPFDPVFEDPTGGNSYGFFSTEYTFKIAEPFRFALFYDWGFLEASEWDFNPENYNDNWGLGVRILVLGAPLRLDYGIPITSNDINDEGGQFHFSFGTRF